MLLSPHSRWRHRAGIGDCGPGEPEPALGGPGAPHRCLPPPLPHAPLTRWSNPKLFLPPSFIPAALTAHRPLHSCFGPGGGSGELVHFAASSRDARTPGPAWGRGGVGVRRGGNVFCNGNVTVGVFGSSSGSCAHLLPLKVGAQCS